MKMSGSQMFLFLCAEFVEFFSQRRSGAVFDGESEGQKGKQVIYVQSHLSDDFLKLFFCHASFVTEYLQPK